MQHPPDPAGPSAARPSRRLDRRTVTALTWVVLALVPVLWVVELTGPEWLNLSLRALWVVVAIGTVAAGVVLYSSARRSPSGAPDREARPG